MRFVKAKVFLALIPLVSMFGVTELSAARARVPGKPVIVSIVSTRVSAKYVRMTFTVELPSANGSRILGTTVSASGGAADAPKCTIKGSNRSCTIARVRVNMYRVWTARSRNKVGMGARSARVMFQPVPGRWLMAGYTPDGLRIPAPVSLTGGTRVLQNARTNSQVQRWSKFQAIRQSGVIAASVRAASVPSVNPPTITFLTSGVVGLALPSTGGTGSGLLAVNRDGSTVDALLSGSASIRDFYAAPNNKFYVVFTAARPLYTGGPNCILAEVDADTGNPVCVDSQITAVSSSFGVFGPFSGTVTNAPIQFDQAGNIYYVGTIPNTSSVPGPAMTTLRRSSNGVMTSLVTDNSMIRDFLVLEDGSVIVSGMTSSTQTSWVRRISRTGSLSNISSSSQSNFLRRFSDGNIYMSFMGAQMGVQRFLPATGAMDPKPWIGWSGTGLPEAHFSPQPLCSGVGPTTSYPGFCGGSGGMISASFNVGTSKTLVVAGFRSAGGTSLFQYVPTVAPITVSMKNITLATMVGRKLILAGTTAEGVNSMSVLNLDTYQETVLIDASNEIEVYNLSYITATNKIMFNGLRFADNTFVVGEADLP